MYYYVFCTLLNLQQVHIFTKQYFIHLKQSSCCILLLIVGHKACTMRCLKWFWQKDRWTKPIWTLENMVCKTFINNSEGDIQIMYPGRVWYFSRKLFLFHRENEIESCATVSMDKDVYLMEELKLRIESQPSTVIL